jgi:hypothetical protein
MYGQVVLLGLASKLAHILKLKDARVVGEVVAM